MKQIASRIKSNMKQYVVVLFHPCPAAQQDNNTRRELGRTIYNNDKLSQVCQWPAFPFCSVQLQQCGTLAVLCFNNLKSGAYCACFLKNWSAAQGKGEQIT